MTRIMTQGRSPFTWPALRTRPRRLAVWGLTATLLPITATVPVAAEEAPTQPAPLEFEAADPWADATAADTALDPSTSGEIAVWPESVAEEEVDALWESAFAGPGLDGAPYSAVVWDDGDGAALYVGGEFLTAGEHKVNGVARWDGAEWAPLTGSSGTGVGGWTGGPPTRVLALAVHEGDLIVGGNFTSAGGLPATHIARWDGDEWSAFDGPTGPGLDARVQALVSHDGELIAAGEFRRAGGDPSANWIASWDGTTWTGLTGTTPSGLAGNLSGTVRALAIYDGELVAAGGFLAIAHWDGFNWVDRVFAGGIARWDGTDWNPLTGPSGTGTDSFVNALVVARDELFVGGSFTEAGGLPAAGTASWDGAAWTGLDRPTGTGSHHAVYTLAEDGGGVIAAGGFIDDDGASQAMIARWADGWSSLAADGVTLGGVAVQTVAVFDGRVFAGGQLDAVGDAWINHAAVWDGDGWTAVGSSSGILGAVSAAAVFGGELVVGGNFDHAGDAAASNIARWDGTRWAPLGDGTNNHVTALAVYDGLLIAGGLFTEAGGVPAERIAAWDGTGWVPLGSGVGGSFSPRVQTLLVYDDALIVGGDFVEAGGVAANNIATWDGSAWAPLGSGVTGGVREVLALAEYDGALVAGGRFSQAGGVTVNRIASWDGTEWSPLTGSSGTGVSLMVNGLAVLEDTLIVGGSFNRAGGLPAAHIAAWDGSEWTPIEPGIGNFSVSALTEYNGAVIAGGAFTQIDGEPVNGIARWDGTEWTTLSGPLGVGVSGREVGSSVLMLESLADGPSPLPGALLAGGTFLTTGGVANWGLGVYGAQEPGEPEPPELALSAEPYAYKYRGTWYADLAWTGTTDGEVDVYRDGELVATAPNSGSHTDELGKPKRGSVFLYRICHAGTDACSNTVRVRLSPRGPQADEPEVTITTTELPALHVLEGYQAELTAGGGVPPYTWSVTGLPAGLVVDPATGVVANDPEAPAITGIGESTLTVRAVDSTGISGAATLTLDVVGVESVASGESHTCALTEATSVYCWGRNSSGELGRGSTSEAEPLPAPVAHPDDPERALDGITALAAGAFHACALTVETTAVCWGYNGAGQLGIGTSGFDPVTVPVTVTDPDDPDRPLTGLTTIAAGTAHTCATTQDGTAWCWGDNFFGQLGNRSTASSPLPVAVVDPSDVTRPLAGLTHIVNGNLHTCAGTDTGGAYCWGWNIGGQLGKGTPNPGPTSVPAAVVDPADPSRPITGLARLAAGNIQTCAATAIGTAYCWGQNTYGQLGNGGEPANIAVPSAVVDPSGSGEPLTGVVDVATGGLHGCAVTAEANAVCWGLNDHGQLGDGSAENTSTPVVVAGPEGASGGVAQLSLGGWRTCATTESGLAACWGGNAYGQLGDGTTENRSRPSPVHPSPLP